MANGINLPCAIIEFAPASSTGPFQIDGNGMVIPAGGVQVEFEILVSGWGDTPRSPLLGAFNMVLDGDSLLGSSAVPPNPGVGLTTPIMVDCETATDCPEPSPPPVTQTGTCGVMFSGWCDDFVPAFFVPRVCSDDLATPCHADGHCPTGVRCVDHPRFVFPSDLGLTPRLVIFELGGNWFQWAGFPAEGGAGREDPDGVTRFVAAYLRLIVPEDARGTYNIRFLPGPDRTFLLEPLGMGIPTRSVDGQLTIGGACCMADGSCEILLEGECEGAGGTDVGGLCPAEGDACIRDCNGNGIDDADEFIAFADCLAGPGRTPEPQAPECAPTCMAAFDFDDDHDVDLNDFHFFQSAFPGPQ
ncbi:MAG: hypothetical protein ACYTFA_02560 [Planctomycetota bacterium]|jgi:hypothetical protein